MVLTESTTFRRTLDLLEPALQPALYRTRPLGFVGGLAGLALSCGYLGRYVHPRYTEAAGNMADFLTEELVAGNMRAATVHTLSTGLAGMLYSLHALRQLDATDRRFGDDSFASLVDLMVAASLKDFTKDNVDYLHGPLGVFLYLLTQWPRPHAEAGMDRLFDAYRQQIKWDERGARCYNSVLQGQTGEEYNFGLAHGMSGHVLILAEAYRRGYRRAETGALIEGLLRYLDAYRRPDRTGDPHHVYYPKAVIENDPTAWSEKQAENYRVRIGWCYGDLNVALAQMKAGAVMDDRPLYRAGLRLARHTARRRDPEDTQVNSNAFFCHGAAGNSYMYAALYRGTRDPLFLETAEYWQRYLDPLLEDEALEALPPHRLTSFLSGVTGLVLGQLPLKQPGLVPAADLLLHNLQF